MTASTYTLVTDGNGDWAAIYCDGKLVSQGHCSSMRFELLRMLPNVTLKDGEGLLNEWESDEDTRPGEFPERLRDHGT